MPERISGRFFSIVVHAAVRGHPWADKIAPARRIPSGDESLRSLITTRIAHATRSTAMITER